MRLPSPNSALPLLLACLTACTSTEPGEPVSVLEAASPRSAAAPAANAYDRPGFVTDLDADGRLWVFREGGPTERSEKHVTLVGVGPDRRTVRALDRETALAFLATKPGFEVELDDGRLWVFRSGTPHERTEKHVTLVGAGPRHMTVKAADRATAVDYVVCVPGFATEVVDGRLWVHRADAPRERPEKHVTRVGAGPLRMTVKASDRELLDAYLAAVGE